MPNGSERNIHFDACRSTEGRQSVNPIDTGSDKEG